MEQKRKDYALYGLILALLIFSVPAHGQTIITPVSGVATVDINQCGQGGASPNPTCSFQLLLTANTTLAFNNVFSGVQVNLFINPATFTLTWPASVSSPPALTASVVNTVSLRYNGATGVWTASGAGGGSASTFGSALVNPLSLGVAATWQIETNGANFTITSGSSSGSCSSCHFTTVAPPNQAVPYTVNQQIVGFATSWGGSDGNSYNAGACTANGVNPIIFTILSDSTFTMSSNGSAFNAAFNCGTTNGNVGVLAWGIDDDTGTSGGANANSAWSKVETATSGGLNCLPSQFPAGITDWSQSHWNNAAPNCRGISGGSTASRYVALVGWAVGNNTTILLPPWFNRSTCTATSCTGAASFEYISFNGLGQGNFNGAATGSFFYTVNDQTYMDDAFWGFGCGGSNPFPDGVTLNGGYHSFRNITVDGFGALPLVFNGADHSVYEWFAATCGASNPSVSVNGDTGSFGGAFNIGGSGIGIQVQVGHSYWSYNELVANTFASGSACIQGNTGTHIYIRGLGCQNSGNTVSIGVKANGGQLIIEESNVGGGATGRAIDCTTAGSSCSTGVGGNIYGANPIGTIGCAAGTGTSPATCNANSSGLVAVNTGLTSFTVNTTAITPNSVIIIQQDTTTTAGTALGVTCNTTANTPLLTAKTTGTSFVFSLTAPVTNPACFSFTVQN